MIEGEAPLHLGPTGHPTCSSTVDVVEPRFHQLRQPLVAPACQGFKEFDRTGAWPDKVRVSGSVATR